jgi:hypothetical protein
MMGLRKIVDSGFVLAREIAVRERLGGKFQARKI